MLIKNGLIITMNQRREIYQGDIQIEKNRILATDREINYNNDEVFDASGYIIIPGFIQTHTHLCQTLFRNLADDLPLITWLKEKIWPMEGMHSPESLRLSAKLGISELLLGGTTTIMDMGTINHMDVVFEEIENSGIRAFCGKTMMDDGDIPDSLKESTNSSIESSLKLLEKWHNSCDQRIKYAFAPRFVLSCSEDLLTETAKLAENYNIPFHTHAAETQVEIDIIKDKYDQGNISYFNSLGATDTNLCLAHCIWLNENEKNILKDYNVKVLHCPSSNLKLGSGIAPIPDYLERDIIVSIGADGAPCNNNLNMFQEMRLAALIQKPHYGPQCMNAEQVMSMATIDGARTLGLEQDIGSIESGKKADLTFLKINQIQSIPFDNLYTKIVYSTNQDAVTHVMVDGCWLVKDRHIKNYSPATIESEVNSIYQTFIH